MSIEVFNAFTSVVHEVPAENLQAQNAFVSVVHIAPVENLQAQNAFLSVVHVAALENLQAQNAFTSVVHALPVAPKTGPPIQGEFLLQESQFQGWALERGPGQFT